MIGGVCMYVCEERVCDVYKHTALGSVSCELVYASWINTAYI